MELENVKKTYGYDTLYSILSDCDGCLKTQRILHQGDDYPTCIIDIFLECECGEYVHFKLPVN